MVLKARSGGRTGQRGKRSAGRRGLRAGPTVGGMLAMLLLAGCGGPQASKAAAPAVAITEAESAKLRPRDPRLAQLYESSCVACHTVRDTGAPLTGSRAAWDPRWQKGLPALVESAVAGRNGMPAGGQCFACSREDYEALIRFMAAR